MKLKAVFLIPLALSSVTIVGMILYTNETLQDIHYYKVRGSATQKSFIYLTETEQCLPEYLASSSQIGDSETCNCDVIVLSFRAKCQDKNQSHITYLFDSNTLFASGRNVLFFAAMDRRPGYHYYIFINDDTILKYNEFTPANMTKMSPFRAVEKWLLDYEPAVGVLDYKQHHGASTVIKKRRDICGINETTLVLPTVYFDAIFNAFHLKAVEHVLPYPTQYERVCMYCCNRDTVMTVEVKFGGQALLFSPVTAGNLRHRKYNRAKTNMTEISREFIAKMKQEAPPTLRNHVIFEMLHTGLKYYLDKMSPSFCVNVTRHEPIIPYRHLLNAI